MTSLVTGGAGFIGSHLVDGLLKRGQRVRILDNLDPQAHPDGPPPHLQKDAELIVGDLRDPSAVDRALEGVSVVYHLGGMVGNGQSMQELRQYVDVNSVGTATLLEQLIRRRSSIRRLVVASSMVVYGDGAYTCREHGTSVRAARPESRLARKQWEPVCQECACEVDPIAIAETHPLGPNSVYGVTKRDQEELCLVTGRTFDIPTIALRYLCTYGSRQALGNPYTGVIAIWASRLLNGRPPVIFEDGRQLRDFVHVSDVVAATISAGHAPPSADYAAYNVGSGAKITIGEVARMLTQAIRPELAPEKAAEYRLGDIRHCFADISLAQTRLGWRPVTPLSRGIAEFLDWAMAKRPTDRSDQAMQELRASGVIR